MDKHREPPPVGPAGVFSLFPAEEAEGEEGAEGGQGEHDADRGRMLPEPMPRNPGSEPRSRMPHNSAAAASVASDTRQ